jgi:hypothetical protein
LLLNKFIFAQLNPLTQTSEITPAVEARIDELYENFENVVKPELIRQLAGISFLRNLVPGEVHTCVNESVER